MRSSSPDSTLSLPGADRAPGGQRAPSCRSDPRSRTLAAKGGAPVDAVALVRRLHQHRSWVNEKLLAAAALLSDEQLRRPFPIGQGSVWKTLLHLYAGEYVWLEALEGNEDPV